MRHCGSITVTSGEWKLTQNPSTWKKITRTLKGDAEKADLLMGNPLTFNDSVAEAYGNQRFGHNEGRYGALATRFGLIDGKRWFRRTACITQAVIDTAVRTWSGCEMPAPARARRRCSS